MNMFKSILVPLDGSPLAESVLPHVVAMALPLGASVTLVNVCEPPAQDQTTQPVSALGWRLRTAEADAYLEGISARLEEVGLDVESKRLEGKPPEQILAFAHQNDSDLIVLSSHGRSGLTGWNVSSVVQKIIARARVSLMIVRAYRPSTSELTHLTYSRLLYPLDCSLRAEHALPLATMLARSHAAKLILAHVLVRPEMPRRRPLTGEELEAIDKVIELNRAEAKRWLEGLRSSQVAEQVDVETRLVVSNNPAQSLHDLVKREDIDLVTMSAHGYSGSTSWPYGSLALDFIAYGTTPLLIAQDLSLDQIELSEAEIVAQEPRGR
jgi:nucleotide-binding universal stress UspA family protein